MTKHKFFMIAILCLCFLFPAVGISQDISDYLILQDIGPYRLSVPKELIPGVAPVGGPRIINASGVLGPSYHFQDHLDITYELRYLGGEGLPSPTVQVTQHAGSESDKWLLHEVEDGYRDGEIETLGLITQGTRVRDVNGNKIIAIRGSGYSWISNYVAVDISYTDLYGSKPEPLEIVKAYLAKHPSTITLTDTDMKSNTHNKTWIKDEMERRLWLCDKWFMPLQLGKAGQAEVLKESVEHMEVFLNYREKYYGISGEEEKDLLNTYLGQKSGTEIKNRLEALKQWWTDNRENPINL